MLSEYLGYPPMIASVLLVILLFTDILDKPSDTLVNNKLFFITMLITLYDVIVDSFLYISGLEDFEIRFIYSIIYNAIFLLIYFFKRKFIHQYFFAGYFILFFISVFYLVTDDKLTKLVMENDLQGYKALVASIMLVLYALFYGAFIYIPYRYLRRRFGFKFKDLFKLN